MCHSLLLLLALLVLIHCKSIHLISHLLLYSALKSFQKLIGSDKANMFSQPVLSLSLFFLHRACLETKICVLKQSWIRRVTPAAYRRWQVMANYWELANCWSISTTAEISFYLKDMNTQWSCLLGLFCGGCYFPKKKKKNTFEILFYFFPFFFTSFVTSSCVLSHLGDTLCSPSKHTYAHITWHSVTHTHTHTFPLTTNLLSFSHTSTHTHTHSHTPLVAISATLLTGANQSYNTFIISSPPQAPSPLSEISFRPLWMFHCTGNTQLHHGHGGTGPGRKQPPTIRHQTDQVWTVRHTTEEESVFRKFIHPSIRLSVYLQSKN